MARHATGHVQVRKGKRGDVFYVKLRHPSGSEQRIRLGRVWSERSRPPAGIPHPPSRGGGASSDPYRYSPRRDSRPGTAQRRTFGDAVAEWLRYVELDKGRKPSTLRDYRSTAYGAFVPEFGDQAVLGSITDEHVRTIASGCWTGSARAGPRRNGWCSYVRGQAGDRPQVDSRQPADKWERCPSRRSGSSTFSTSNRSRAWPQGRGDVLRCRRRRGLHRVAHWRAPRAQMARC